MTGGGDHFILAFGILAVFANVGSLIQDHTVLGTGGFLHHSGDNHSITGDLMTALAACEVCVTLGVILAEADTDELVVMIGGQIQIQNLGVVDLLSIVLLVQDGDLGLLLSLDLEGQGCSHGDGLEGHITEGNLTIHIGVQGGVITVDLNIDQLQSLGIIGNRCDTIGGVHVTILIHHGVDFHGNGIVITAGFSHGQRRNRSGGGAGEGVQRTGSLSLNSLNGFCFQTGSDHLACSHDLSSIDGGGSLVAGLSLVQACGPDIGAHVANIQGFEAAGGGVVGQVVDLIGLAGEMRQVQIAVGVRDQGAVLAAGVHGVGQIQVSGDEAQTDGAGTVKVQGPQGTGVVQSQIHIGVGIGLGIVVVAVIADGNETVGAGVAGQVASQVPAAGEGVVQVCNGTQEVAAVNTEQIGGIATGKHGGCSHIKVGSAECGTDIGHSDSSAGVRIQLVHLAAGGILDEHDITVGVVSNVLDVGLDGIACGPGIVFCQVPGELHGSAVGILQDAVQGGIQLNNGDCAGGGDGLVCGSGDGDHSIAGSNSGNNAVFINGCHGLIGRGPDDAAVGSVDRIDNGSQLLGVADDHHQSGIGQIDALQGIGDFTDLGLDLVGGSVHGVVINLQQEVGTIDRAQIQSEFHGIACGLGGIGATVGVQVLTVDVVQGNSCDVLVVGSGDSQDIAVGVDIHIVHSGSSVVDDHGHGESSAVAQCIEVYITFCVNVVLGNQGQTDVNGGTLLNVGLQTQAQGVVGAVPVAAVGVIVGRADLADVLAPVDLTGLGVDHLEVGVSCITDGGEAQLGQGIAADHAECVTLGHVGGVGDHGVAAEPVLAIHVGVLDQQTVVLALCESGAVQVGKTILQTMGEFHVGALVEHGGIGPVAVECQHGDGMGGASHALCSAQGLGIDVSFDVSAAFVVCQPILVVSTQSDGDGDLGRAVGRHNCAAGVQHGEEQVGVIGIDDVVHVQVCQTLVVQGDIQTGGVVQQDLTVSGVDFAVTVEVHADQFLTSGDGLAVDSPCHIGRQECGPGVQQQNALVGEGVLSEDVSGQREGLLHIGQVVDGEGEGVDAGLLGIVAQLCLDLAVCPGIGGIGAHDDVGISGGSSAHIGKTCALLDHGIVVAAAGAVTQGLCGGHQQTLGQGTLVQTGLLSQTALADILCHQGSHTGDLRSSHGGTGHDLVGLVIAEGAIVDGTGDGIDAAAGGSDLRLQLQGTGNAPGGEGGHGVVLAAILTGAHGIRNFHRAGPVGDAGLGGVLGTDSLEDLAVSLQDGDDGNGVLVTGQVHVDDACLVIDHDDTGCTHGGSVVGLLEEGGGAAVAHDDLAGQHFSADCLKVSQLADGVDEDEFLGTAQGGHGGVAILGTIVVGDDIAADVEIQSGEAIVIDGSNGECVGVGAGRAVGLEADVIQIQVRQTVLGALCPVAGVTGGDGDHDARLLQGFHDALVGVVDLGHAGVAGAQGQVDGVSAQDHGILNGSHVVGVISAAVLAKDLHDHQLGIGSDTLDIVGFQCGREGAVAIIDVCIGGGNTGNVGAVLTLGVIEVDDVQIIVNVVEAEGDLGVDVQILSADISTLVGVQLSQDRRDVGRIHQIHFLIQQGQGVIECGGIESFVLDVSAGIDDGDLGACAGVTGTPDGGGADLGGGGCHVGIGSAGADHIGLIASLDGDALDACDLFNSLDLTIFNVGRDDVGSQGQIPDNVQILLDRLFDLSRHIGLILFNLAAIVHGGTVFSDVHGRVTGFDGAGLLQNDGNSDYVGIGVGSFLFGQLDALTVRERGGDPIVVNLLEADRRVVNCIYGRRIAGDHGDDQDHAEKTLHESSSHILTPLR